MLLMFLSAAWNFSGVRNSRTVAGSRVLLGALPGVRQVSRPPGRAAVPRRLRCGCSPPAGPAVQAFSLIGTRFGGGN